MLKKEFVLVLRDKHSLAALFIMPSIFILIMSIALKDTFSDDRAFIRYNVTDNDQSNISRSLSAILDHTTNLQQYDHAITDSKELQAALNKGLHFALTIPKGFSEKFIVNTSKNLLRLDVASEVKMDMLNLFKGELSNVLMQIRIEQMLQQFEPVVPGITAQINSQAIDTSDLVNIHFNGLPPNKIPTSTQQSVPSWIVFGMFFIIIPMSTIFINERKQNTLMRMSAMNISIPILFAGKIIPYMLINQIQVWLMIGVGIFIVPFFGADALTLGNSLTGLLLVSTGLSLAAIGTSMVIAVSVNSVEQATTIGGILNILFGAIGGVMVPKFLMPQSMQMLSNISPMSWGLDGFLDIFLRGLSVQEVLTEAFALAGFGIIQLLIAGLLFSRKKRNGI